MSARANCRGNSLPRLTARRRIPAQARALKKYRRGTSPVTKISDNEHTPASLRDSPSKPVHSHELSVKHSPGRMIPEFGHAPDESGKGAPPPPLTKRRGRFPKPAMRADSVQQWQDR